MLLPAVVGPLPADANVRGSTAFSRSFPMRCSQAAMMRWRHVRAYASVVTRSGKLRWTCKAGDFKSVQFTSATDAVRRKLGTAPAFIAVHSTRYSVGTAGKAHLVNGPHGHDVVRRLCDVVELLYNVHYEADNVRQCGLQR